jgi:hypothetical protein
MNRTPVRASAATSRRAVHPTLWTPSSPGRHPHHPRPRPPHRPRPDPRHAAAPAAAGPLGRPLAGRPGRHRQPRRRRGRPRRAGRLHGQLAAPPAAPQPRRRRQRRGLWTATTWEGMVALQGLLDPEAGQTLLTALEPLAPVRPAPTNPGAGSSAAPMPWSSWPAGLWRQASCPSLVGCGPSCWSPAPGLVRRPPPPALAGGWPDRPGQPGPGLPGPAPGGPRGRLAAHPRPRRTVQRHPTPATPPTPPTPATTVIA